MMVVAIQRDRKEVDRILNLLSQKVLVMFRLLFAGAEVVVALHCSVRL